MLRHLLPHDAELSSKNETGEGDQKQAKGQEGDCDQATKDRSRGYLAVTYRRDRCFQS